MQYKKFFIWIFTFLFVAIVIIAMLFAAVVNRFETEYTLIGDYAAKAEALDSKLQVFLGKNSLFLDTEEIVDEIESDPYYECVSISKSFPDTVKISVKERRETYYLVVGGEKYVTDESGIVLKSFKGDAKSELIAFSLSGISISDTTLGRKISTDFDEYVNYAFNIADSINLSDFVKEIVVERIGSGDVTGYVNAKFYLKTGVKIVVEKIDDDGAKKANEAFSTYNSLSDYDKSLYSIIANKTVDGEINVVKTTKDV